MKWYPAMSSLFYPIIKQSCTDHCVLLMCCRSLYTVFETDSGEKRSLPRGGGNNSFDVKRERGGMKTLPRTAD